MVSILLLAALAQHAKPTPVVETERPIQMSVAPVQKQRVIFYGNSKFQIVGDCDSSSSISQGGTEDHPEAIDTYTGCTMHFITFEKDVE
jgi:hypothetical protein